MVMSNYMHSLVCMGALLPFVNMYKFYRNLRVKTVSHTDSSVVQVLCAMEEGNVDCIIPPPPPMHAGFGDDSDDSGITPPPPPPPHPVSRVW